MAHPTLIIPLEVCHLFCPGRDRVKLGATMNQHLAERPTSGLAHSRTLDTEMKIDVRTASRTAFACLDTETYKIDDKHAGIK